MTPRILFEDANVIVLSKPAGLLSQGAKEGEANLVDWLRGYLERHYVGLVHRLDRNVSGLMVVAKRTKAASRLSEALKARKLKRRYAGWVRGKIERRAKWEDFLLKDTRTNEVKIVREGTQGAKRAALTLEPKQCGKWQGEWVTLVYFSLETGRSHQIRVQCASRKHALLGDPKYGKGTREKLKRPALHAIEIEFPHPIGGEVMRFSDELPADLKKIETEIRKNDDN